MEEFAPAQTILSKLQAFNFPNYNDVAIKRDFLKEQAITLFSVISHQACCYQALLRTFHQMGIKKRETVEIKKVTNSTLIHHVILTPNYLLVYK